MNQNQQPTQPPTPKKRTVSAEEARASREARHLAHLMDTLGVSKNVADHNVSPCRRLFE